MTQTSHFLGRGCSISFLRPRYLGRYTCFATSLKLELVVCSAIRSQRGTSLLECPDGKRFVVKTAPEADLDHCANYHLLPLKIGLLKCLDT